MMVVSFEVLFGVKRRNTRASLTLHGEQSGRHHWIADYTCIKAHRDFLVCSIVGTGGQSAQVTDWLACLEMVWGKS